MKTQNKITEGNRLIAEFMGFEMDKSSGLERFHDQGGTQEQKNFPQSFYKYDMDHYKERHTYYADDLKYHTSWDWLMPVVGKIRDTGKAGGLLYGLREALAKADIDYAYKEVVTFIKWYNENK